MNRSLRKKSNFQNRTSIEIIEEAMHLLCRSPVEVHVTYLLGTVPFILGFLYFWSDMSQNAFASQYCAEFSWLLAILYIWMKCWQSIHASQLKAQITQLSIKHDFRKIAFLIRNQLIIQPSLFIILPISMLLTLPFGWTYSFYHNFSCFSDKVDLPLGEVIRRAWKQALLWPGQNHFVISIFTLLTIVVFLNVASAICLGPMLLKTLLGIENTFTDNTYYFIFNTTFLVITSGITYLCVNPIIKAVYVLRCFYGESIHTGEDLKTELNLFKQKNRLTAVVSILLLLCSVCTTRAQEQERTEIQSSKLDERISEEIRKPEYAWKIPKEKMGMDKEKEEGVILKFLKEIRKKIEKWTNETGRWLRDQWNKLFKDKKNKGFDAQGWESSVNVFFFILLGLIASTLAIIAFRLVKNRKKKINISATPVTLIPDLNQEDIQADQLASDEWLTLAKQLLETGELRLALRAFYLSVLANLAQQEWIRIAKFKSNMDYQKELERRAHSFPELIEAFRENRMTFESVWYGMHEVNQHTFDHFIQNHEKIRSQSRSPSDPIKK